MFKSLEELHLPAGKKVYFASDFHLGAPDKDSSRKREKKIIEWLESIRKDAHSIFLLGDLFDFWFEYKHAIPKGFIRFQGKLAELVDEGINIIIFTGNHDMWMFDYFPKEFSIPVYKEPHQITINNKNLLIGHGDGLGPGDLNYKLLKRIFRSRVSQWLFARIHPNTGIGIANFWSGRSRISNLKKNEEQFLGEKEFLWQFCKKIEKAEHHDYYIFGHRHLVLELEVGTNSRYINLGEWVTGSNYAIFDGNQLKLHTFE
ncbi:MAG: UDP-2,3-diacylglucosamine diphosphatase [Candidatus Cyclobacteriaceae bacterium M2_1C_046]